MSVPPPPYQGPAQPPFAPQQNQKALWSMILGIAGVPFVFFCCAPVGFMLGIAALILGILGRQEINNSGGSQAGSGLATAGVVLGGVVIMGTVLMFVAGIALHLSSGSGGLVKPPF